jgi:hypothetical protein
MAQVSLWQPAAPPLGCVRKVRDGWHVSNPLEFFNLGFDDYHGFRLGPRTAADNGTGKDPVGCGKFGSFERRGLNPAGDRVERNGSKRQMRK